MEDKPAERGENSNGTAEQQQRERGMAKFHQQQFIQQQNYEEQAKMCYERRRKPKSFIPTSIRTNHTIEQQFLALYEDCLVGHQKPRRV